MLSSLPFKRVRRTASLLILTTFGRYLHSTRIRQVVFLRLLPHLLQKATLCGGHGRVGGKARPGGEDSPCHTRGQGGRGGRDAAVLVRRRRRARRRQLCHCDLKRKKLIFFKKNKARFFSLSLLCYTCYTTNTKSFCYTILIILLILKIFVKLGYTF